MKIKIQQRKVYHKYAEVEIEIDKDDYMMKFLKGEVRNLQDYIQENEDMYLEKMNIAMDETSLQYGNGVYELKGMSYHDQDEEWRMECDELKLWGHL
tara:strand:+ start:39 stop:329 length:291 start_codon:yes stop_codon:yes gene_type:complete